MASLFSKLFGTESKNEVLSERVITPATAGVADEQKKSKKTKKSSSEYELKFREVQSAQKAAKLSPCRICKNYYSTLADVDGMQRVLELYLGIKNANDFATAYLGRVLTRLNNSKTAKSVTDNMVFLTLWEDLKTLKGYESVDKNLEKALKAFKERNNKSDK